MGRPSAAGVLAAHRRRLRLSRMRLWGAAGLVVLLLSVAAFAALRGALDAGLREVPAEVKAPDADGDGVPDVVENFVGTDPLARRPSGSLPEVWLQRHGLDASDPDLANRTAPYPRPPDSPEVYGAQGLPPEDRMTYLEVYSYRRPAGWDEQAQGEWTSGLDPARWDVNGSGVPYSWLVKRGLDPFDVAALDVRGAAVPWTPREAYERGLHPTSPDGDEDGLPDVEEERLRTSPRLYSTTGSGIADGWLVAHGFDALDPAVAHADVDRDGLPNLQEFEASLRLDPERTLAGRGLDPRKASSGGGPIPDGWLVRHGLDPLDAGVASRVTEEKALPGRDGRNETRRLSVLDEYLVGRPPLWNETVNGPWLGGSDPSRDDSDDDGLSDLEELTGREIRRGGGAKWVVSDPTRGDTDSDGLLDGQEYAGRAGAVTFSPTDPSAPDSDVDGLLDGEELGVVPWRGVRLPALDPTADDTDADGLVDGVEAVYWLRRSEEADAGTPYAWGPKDRPRAAQALAREGLPETRVAAALLPGGDLDADDLANVLDPDSDGDGLLDGWEAKPELYLASPFAAPQARRATDPANGDTDLDGLPDRWEVRYGLFDERVGGWNLDPALWSSFHDEISDADRDLDGDGATWWSYQDGPAGRKAVSNVFNATNRIELEAGSDPNRRSSSPDNVADGWKIFWGKTYFTLAEQDLGVLYPGAPGDLVPPPDRPAPRIGADDAVTLGAATVSRTRLVDGSAFREEQCADGRLHDTRDASGATLKVCVLSEEVAFDHRAAAREGTNPYLDDTDGDGVPDAWEAAWAPLGAGKKRVSPVTPDADGDLDEDGLANGDEWRAGASPYLADSDLGGAGDEAEWRLALDPFNPTDDARALDSDLDTDGDTVPDVAEALGRYDAEGNRIRTDPRDVDTDRDGLLDGESLSEVLGRSLFRSNPSDAALLEGYQARGLLVVELSGGEADVGGEVTAGGDPSRLSTSGEGIPDGWVWATRASTTLKEPTGLLQVYAYGRPAWWNESQHGVWRWGLKPGQTATRDLDGDGLDDKNGEDPIPYANARNALPRGDPREEGVSSMERLLRAQAYGGLPPLPDPKPRFQGDLTLDPLPEPLPTNGTARFTGNLTTLVGGRPVANATVVLSLETREVVLGVALTNETGAFNATLALSPTHAAPEGSEGVPVFGAQDATGVHANAAEVLRRLDVSATARVFAWTYNESLHPPPRQARGLVLDGVAVGGLASAESARRIVAPTLETRVSIGVPSPAPVGESRPVDLELRDALARPVAGVDVRLDPPGVNVTTDAAGRARVFLTLPLAPGPFPVSASFAGAGRLLASNATASIPVTDATRLEILPPPLAGRPNESFTLAGLLRTTRGAPIAGANVTLTGPGLRASALTDADGSFAHAVFLTLDAPTGDVAYVARFPGNETLVESNATLLLPIRGAPRWIAEPVRGAAGSDATLLARLLDARGTPLGGREATLLLPAGATLANRTDAEGRIGFRLDLRDARPGETLARLSFHDAVQGDADLSVSVLVTTTTNVTLATDPLARGRDALLRGQLVDGTGATLARQPVVVRLAGATERALTDAQGRYEARFPTATLPPGPIEAAATYAGSADGVHGPAAATLRATLPDAPTLVLDAEPVLASRPVASGRVATLVGEPVDDQEIRVLTPQGEARAFTDRDGRFEVHLTPLAGAPLGPVEITWRFEGHATLLPLDETTRILLKDRGLLRADAPAAVREGATIRVPFALLDSRDRPVADARLAVTLDGRALDVGRSEGAATFTLPREVRAGVHRLVLEGLSDVVAAPRLDLPVDVQRDARLVLVSKPRLAPGETGELVVRLESASQPLAGERLVVDAGRIPYEVATGADGVARVPFTLARTDVALVQVAFPGRGENGPAALALRVDQAAAPLPEDSGPWLLLLLAALVLAALLALVLALRRRKDPARVLQRAARRLRSAHPDVGALYEAYLALLALASLDEDQADTVTFGALLRRFLPDGGMDAETALLTDVFNRAVYAPDLLTPDDVRAASDALGELSARMRPVATA